MILTATGQTKLLRWTATLNLMELASLDGMEEAFDAYAKELADAPLGCWVRSHYLLFLGEGMARFGRMEAAENTLREAVSFAEANQVHNVVFQAESCAQRRSFDASPSRPLCGTGAVDPGRDRSCDRDDLGAA